MVTVVTARAKHGPRQPRPLLKAVLDSGSCGIDERLHLGYNVVITQEVEMIKQLRKVGNSNA
jgi:hypothetical protein